MSLLRAAQAHNQITEEINDKVKNPVENIATHVVANYATNILSIVVVPFVVGGAILDAIFGDD